MKNITDEIRRLLKEIGAGRMSSTAYDTAWVARLGDVDQELSRRAMGWICENQLLDGSWGTKEIYYYHDRVICTLAAMIALTYQGKRMHDKTQIEKGLQALDYITSGATGGLAADPNGATVGFEMIVPTLVLEAERLGIIKQQGNQILGRISRLRDLKMSKLAGKQISRHITPAFSAEMAGKDMLHLLDIENLQESNGSVGNSPSATAHFALQVRPGDSKALTYIRGVMQDGAAPFAFPFNIFERSWVLWNLSLINSLDKETQELCQPHLEFLWDAWRPERGVGFSTTYTPEDGDDSSLTFDVLSRYGKKVGIDAVLNFEEDDYFRCYPLESNSSISVNIHVLGALRQAGFDKHHPSIKKIVNFLKRERQQDAFWRDKWHISPYYPTSHAIIACIDYDDELCQSAVDWILGTQKSSGAWGSYNNLSTAEETAYCLQALQIWQAYKGNIPHSRIEQGLIWLEQNVDSPHPPLWIGKVLYSPKYVVRSTILSALAISKQ